MILDASKQVWVLDYQVPQKIILARIKVLVAKVPIVCAALDYEGGDSGQIILILRVGEAKFYFFQ